MAGGCRVITFPRTGFMRVSDNAPRSRAAVVCGTGKKRYATESAALDALIRVRKLRQANPDGRDPENRIYFCSCKGWHLTSGEMGREDFSPVKERGDGEPWESYARRLERRIAEQRAHLLSLHALGHGASNREGRKRIASLLRALGRMTERWESERSQRQALVEILSERCSCRRCRRRLRDAL